MTAPFRCQNTLVFAVAITLIAGCGGPLRQPNWHQKFGWKASEYFNDLQVIQLCEAIESDNITDVKRLIADGVNVNAVGKGNMTPLLWAFPENRIDVFKLLLEKGATPNVVVEDEFATQGGIIPGDSVTILAARSAFPDQLALVLQHGGDPNITTRKWKVTPIHEVLMSLAPLDVKKAKIDALAKAGADLNYMSVGRPPVMKGFNMNGPEIVLKLIEVGADPLMPADNGLMRLVHLVARMPPPYTESYMELCRVLESHGESIDMAQRDLERWKSYNGFAPEKAKRLEDKEREDLKLHRNRN